jgi:hypothetical protein
MLQIKTAFDSIIWSDLPEVLTYKEVFQSLTGQLTENYSKNRHLKKIAYFVHLLTDRKELEDPIIQLQIKDINLTIGDGNHRATAIDFIQNYYDSKI